MTNNAAAKVTVKWVENCEGDGTCLACGREGLTWVVVLSDGSRVGVECAKPILGFKPAPKSYVWSRDFTGRGFTVNGGGQTVRVWERNDGRAFALTVDGVLVSSGGREFVTAQFKVYAA